MCGVCSLSTDSRDPIANETLLVLQSGGPTTVINASLVGVLAAARESGRFRRVLGAYRGVEGILGSRYFDLSSVDDTLLDSLRRTPSAALGTSRHRPTDAELSDILTRCIANAVSLVVAIGGNDTADSMLRLHQRAAAAGHALRTIVVPKTIDNDLPGTDHCPGYGSMARFVAHAVRDSAFDTRAMAHVYPIKLIEVMGRNAGWVAAAGGLWDHPRLPRPILCLPERPFADPEALFRVVQPMLDQHGYAVLVVPETMRWANGEPVAGGTAAWVDPFGHPYFPGAGEALARSLGDQFGVRARCDKPGTIARMAMHAVSTVDLAEAEGAGRAAVAFANAGASGVMVTLQRRQSATYAIDYGMVALDSVAAVERTLPDEMIAQDGHDISPAFRDYALPLIGGPLPEYAVLGAPGPA
ncbi:MAG: phosphofructokinase [Chloroflexi bacterium]|nr:MAG: phosphofructokinase [Chloroflexota bacterium]